MEWKVTKLPDDWRLTPEATRRRNLSKASAQYGKTRKQYAAEAQKKKWSKRKRPVGFARRTKLPFRATIKTFTQEYEVEVYQRRGEVWLRRIPTDE